MLPWSCRDEKEYMVTLFYVLAVPGGLSKFLKVRLLGKMITFRKSRAWHQNLYRVIPDDSSILFRLSSPELE